jgi:hypothetical protein
VRDKRLIDLTRVAPLPTPPAGWYDVGYSVTAIGKLAIRRCTLDLHGHGMKRRLDMSLPPLDTVGARHRCLLFDGEAESDHVEFPVNTPRGVCDVFPDGNWLIAGGGRPTEANTCVFSPTGDLIRRFGIGSGFGSVQCDSAGAFWVGYWDVACGDEFNGLLKFDASGEVLWPPNREKVPIHVFDCWTLNVIGEKVWAYYELEYPITSIDAAGEVCVRRCGLEGATAFAVDGEMAILAGGYGEDGEEHDRLVLLRLRDDCAESVETFRIRPSWDLDPERPWLSQGRGDAVHLEHRAFNRTRSRRL